MDGSHSPHSNKSKSHSDVPHSPHGNHEGHNHAGELHIHKHGSMHSSCMVGKEQAQNLSSTAAKVLLNFSCKHLPNDSEIFGNIDPYVKVSTKEEGQNEFIEVGKTNTADNCDNPTFEKPVEVNYWFEKE